MISVETAPDNPLRAGEPVVVSLLPWKTLGSRQ